MDVWMSESGAERAVRLRRQIVCLNEKERFTCAICLCPTRKKVTYLPCGHGFHVACHVRNRKYSSCCPLCRKRFRPLSSSSDDEEEDEPLDMLIERARAIRSLLDDLGLEDSA